MMCKQLSLGYTDAAHHGFTKAYKWSTNIASTQCLSSISICCDSVHIDKYGAMQPVIPSSAKGRTDMGGPQRLGGHTTKQGLVMHSDCSMAKMLGVC
ncbi:hypothetical protein PBY51_009415 [Eleginops maclovinus]|uniref:Uncharacterized protein n=1 Tax=Eleginops maclovinus TaxID=56733 RepID=A0AAN8AUX9_ELEMC|nr:hypothetical protein PBY51_009415 [Eleginops maclovinus]